MSDAIARITQHFESLGTRSIEVPEWGLTIYSTPVTVAERTRIYSGLRGENDYDVLIKILIEKACDAEGKKLFTIADRAKLLQKADSTVVIRVAAQILADAAPKADELKN